MTKDKPGKAPVFRALGLMSGTSADGIDVALIETDGERQVVTGPARAYDYDAATASTLRQAMTLAQGWAVGAPMPRALAAAADLVTDSHAKAVDRFLAETGLNPAAIDIIGFHGQTVLHRPAEGRTVQLGDGAALARRLAIDVVNDFRHADVAAGGQGAPFVPLYHRARAEGLARPLAVLNIGGVANVTALAGDDAILAFDTGPGNGLLDDWVKTHTGARFDRDGALAATGQVNALALAGLLAHPYFTLPPPKSLDRLDFDPAPLQGLAPADGAATLVAFTVEAIARGVGFLAAPPARWYVTGGGRHNQTIMAALAERLGVPVEPVEAVGWRGDMLEAEAFAYLAVRSLKGLPLSLPSTTRVPRPMTGGTYHAGRSTPGGQRSVG